jgi:hypothetical protein
MYSALGLCFPVLQALKVCFEIPVALLASAAAFLGASSLCKLHKFSNRMHLPIGVFVESKRIATIYLTSRDVWTILSLYPTADRHERHQTQTKKQGRKEPERGELEMPERKDEWNVKDYIHAIKEEIMSPFQDHREPTRDTDEEAEE